MKKLILLLFISFISLNTFGQLYSYGGSGYYLPPSIIDFRDYPLVHQDDGWSGLPKKYLMKELKCKSIKDLQKEMESYELNYSEYYDDYIEIKEDIIPIVVSFDVSIARIVTNVKGNSIQDSSIAKNLLDKAKVGDVVALSNFKMILEKGSKETVGIDSFFMFQIIK